MSFLSGANQSLVDEFNTALGTNEQISEELEQWLKDHFGKQLGADVKDIQTESKLPPEALMAESESFEDQLRLVKRLLSPIRSIPVEILSLIFIQFNDNRPVRTIPVSILTQEFGFWQLGHVCSAWRAALLDTHELWSGLELTLDGGSDSVDQKLLDMTKEALSRTGDRLIELQIHECPYPDRKYVVTPTAKSLGAVFRPYIGRVERLGLHAPFYIVDLMNVPWKSLTRLRCSFVYFYSSYYTQARMLDAPKLRELELVHYTRKRVHVLHFFQNTVRNLTSLYLGQQIQFQNPSSLDVLRECLSLEKLECCIDSESSSLESCPFVHLPALHVLNVSIEEVYIQPPLRLKFLGRLTLPALRRLSIHAAMDEPWRLEPEVIPMITRSNCSLREVEVGKMDDEVQFPRFLRLTPDLEFLSMDATDWRPDFMSGMTSGTLLPKIKHLRCRLLFDDEDDFWNMLCKRSLLAPRSSPHGLVTLNKVVVSVDFPADFVERWSSRIAELETAQVDFTVRRSFYEEETEFSPTSSVVNLNETWGDHYDEQEGAHFGGGREMTS